MAISRQEDPRANQKERTRAAIVDAATELVRSGVTPTVQTAAEAAKVSRATAYRYFPTQDALLHEILYITPSLEDLEAGLPELKGQDAVSQTLWLIDNFNPLVLREEAPYRAAMRIFIETWFANSSGDKNDKPRVREGRRMRWLEQTLDPLRDHLPAESWERLRRGLALTLGIDSVVIMRDVCGIEDDEEILDVLHWTAEALLKAAYAEAGIEP